MKLTKEQAQMLNDRGVRPQFGGKWSTHKGYPTTEIITDIEKALTDNGVQWIYSYNQDSQHSHRYTLKELSSVHAFCLGAEETRVEAALQAAKRLPVAKKYKPLTLQIPQPTEEGLCPAECLLSEWRGTREGRPYYRCRCRYDRKIIPNGYIVYCPGPGCPWYKEASDE